MINTLLNLAFGRPGIGELLLILFIILLLFGSKRLPELSRSLGQALKEFRAARKETDPEDKGEKNNADKAR